MLLTRTYFIIYTTQISTFHAKLTYLELWNDQGDDCRSVLIVGEEYQMTAF